VLSTAAVSVVLTISVGTHEQTPPPILQQRSQQYVKEISALSDAELAAAFGTRDVASKSPSSNASQYEEEISALTAAQRAAAYGGGVYSTGPVWTTRLTPKERRYVEGMAALIPAHRAAAFGTHGGAISALGAKERRYVEGITALRPAERAAAFGTGR
jgi:hypothetical protein